MAATLASPNAQAATPAPPWRTAWITGASTGIGREVAVQLAKRGVHVAVSARSASALAELAATHANITAYPLDVTDVAAVRDTLAAIQKAFGGLDLAILNAGVWHPMGASDFDAARAHQSMLVNYTGISNALDPLIPLLKAQGHGHVALVASVAGYRGLPKSAAYSPTKAAVISLAEILRPELALMGITTSVINPGFVETPMTSVNKFPMPFIIGASDAAARIIRGLERRKFEIAFPWQVVGILKLLRILPYALFFPGTSRMMPRQDDLRKR